MDYHFFWKGPLSQWEPSPFVVDSVQYGCAEQYMMAQKALLFGDFNTYRLIMKSNSPKEQKSLGRRVRGFSDKVWKTEMGDWSIRFQYVWEGNMAKFSQNNRLLDILMDTGDKILAEANPYDKIWGIGLSRKDAKLTDPQYWPGKNLLGQVLMSVRMELRKNPRVYNSREDLK